MLRQVDMGANGVHDLILVATEHDSVIAYDGLVRSNTPCGNIVAAREGISPQRLKQILKGASEPARKPRLSAARRSS